MEKVQNLPIFAFLGHPDHFQRILNQSGLFVRWLARFLGQFTQGRTKKVPTLVKFVPENVVCSGFRKNGTFVI
jgi:hypothetical protein